MGWLVAYAPAKAVMPIATLAVTLGTVRISFLQATSVRSYPCALRLLSGGVHLHAAIRAHCVPALLRAQAASVLECLSHTQTKRACTVHVLLH